MTSDELPLAALALELVELTHDADAWIRRLHAAFYGRELPRVGGKFAVLDRVLRECFKLALQRPGEECAAFWRFMAEVLVRIASSGSREAKQKGKKAQSAAPLGFLVVNALKQLVEGEDGVEHKRASLALGASSDLRAFCEKGLRPESSVDPKLLVELLELFQIGNLDSMLVRDAVSGLLASKSHSAVIKLCALCTGVEDLLPDIAKAMTQAKDWVSAELFAQKFDDTDSKALSKILIETAIELREFKRAHRLVDNLGLQDDYPGIDALYSQGGLARLIENRRWKLAITFVGSDSTLQRMLFKSMLAVGELTFASQLVERVQAGETKDEMKKQLSDLPIIENPGVHSQPDSSNIGDYLTLPLGNDEVIFCDSDEGVQAAIDHFFSGGMETVNLPLNGASVSVIGLDVEWKPVSSRSKNGQQPIASILQIASSAKVFIVDLLELQSSSLLFDGLLGRLLSSCSHLKVGFNFESDLKVLRHTFPERSAFNEVKPFLDLTNAKNADSDIVTRKGLSSATTQFLGKPLDKKMQMSDWEQRPLSSQQLQYAALDAFCLVQIVQAISSSTRASWEQTAACVNSLKYPAQLTHGLVLQYCASRVAHHASWKRRITSARLASTLVTPDELQRFWHQRVMDSQCGQPHDEMALISYDHMRAILNSQTSCEQQTKLCPVNSICMFAAEEPRVVCIDARRKLDMAKVAKAFRVGRRKVRLATPSECMAVFGFAPGTVAPFGHRPSGDTIRKIKIYADSNLKKATHLAAGSGVQDKVIWIQCASFFELIDIESVANVALQDPADESTCDDSDTATEPEVIIKAQNAFEYKFLADSMVSQVGRWLRTTGVDVVIWNPVENEVKSHDPKREMLAMAARESRIVLTRDTTLPNRRDAGACFVLSNDECYKQFREVKAQFGLHWRREDRASRCARCNSTHFSVVEPEFVRTQTKEKIQAKVLDSVSKFWSCDDCGKIYWEGPKYTPTGASTDAANDAAGICGVKYRPVARRPVHLIRKGPA